MYEADKTGLEPMQAIIMLAGGVWVVGAALFLIAMTVGNGMI
ncbi:hypothetical protein ACFOOL_16270 [Devosia honganensis]|uniref:Uncharacterized protein n=1 Tax=Devosia honganensis TaxID=1610527 RepID=A0ABV7X570_9HYPH